MEKGSTSAWLTGRVPAVKIHRFSWFFFTLCGDPFRRRYTTVYSYVGRNSIKSNYWCWMLKSGYKLTPCGWICQVRLTYFSTAPLEAVGVSAKYFSGRRLFHLVAFFVCYFLLSPLTILTTKNAVHLRTSVLQAKWHHHKVFVSNCFSMYVRIFIEVLQATLTNRHFHAYLASQSNFSVSFFLSLSLSVHLSLPPPSSCLFISYDNFSCIIFRGFLWRVRKTSRRYCPNSCTCVSSWWLSLFLEWVSTVHRGSRMGVWSQNLLEVLSKCLFLFRAVSEPFISLLCLGSYYFCSKMARDKCVWNLSSLEILHSVLIVILEASFFD